MEKIGLLTREKIVEQVKQETKDANGYLFINFNKVESVLFNNLRNNLARAGAKVFVTKNSLLKRAFSELDKGDLSELLKLETGVVLVYDQDIVKTCKVLVDFSKENEFLKIKGAFIKDKRITPKEVSALAKLPPREVLLGMAVSAIASPLTGFVNSLNQIILKFVWAVKEIKEKKQQKQ